MKGKNVGIVIVLFLASWMTESCTGQVNITDKTNCSLVPMDPHSISRIKELIKNKNRIIKIELEIEGETGPLGENVTNINQILNSKEWFILTEEVSEVMLQFPADYIEKSLYTFSFHQASLQMSVFQQQENCFSDFSLEEILNTIRYHFLWNFTLGNEESTEFLKICNRFIKLSSDNGTGEIKYICCDEKTNDCTVLVPGIWNNMFNICLLSVKCFLMAVSPLFIPRSLSRKFNTTFKYRLDEAHNTEVNLKKMDVNEAVDNKQYKELYKGGNSFKKLKNFIQDLPAGIHSLKVKTVSIPVNEEKVVTENVNPVSFTLFIFRNLVLCKIRDKLSVDECCDAHALFKGACKWLTLLKTFMFLLMFCIIISPWCVTVVFYMMVTFPYYMYLEGLGYLHIITIVKNVHSPSYLYADTVCVALFFVLFCLFNKNGKFRTSIDIVLTCSLNERYKLKKAFSNLVQFIVSPLEELHINVMPDEYFMCPCTFIRWIFDLVGSVIVFLVKTIPLLVVADNSLRILDDKENGYREYLMLLLFYCQMGLLCSSFVVGFISFYIDCVFYTILGILINYDEVFQYVCLIILFLGYTFNSFHTVNMVYRNFSRHICQLLQTRLNSYSWSENETHNDSRIKKKMLNAAHIVPHSKQEHGHCSIYAYKGRLLWKVSRLIVFTGETSTCISRRFFDKMRHINCAAAPGSLFALYAKSFRDLIFVIVFFLFIVLVVFALGKAHDLSASVQTLLAVGGGVLPFLLQKLFKSRNKDAWPLSNDVLEMMVMSGIDLFKEKWEPNDLSVTTLADKRSGNIEIIAKEIDEKIKLFVPLGYKDKYEAEIEMKTISSENQSTSPEKNLEANQDSVEINIHTENLDVELESNHTANESNNASQQNIKLGHLNEAYQEG